ncbi:NADP-dependent oxidoreductase [uncultured Dysgonomonas sp.]|mgnify:CR=1 FL=1|uniref:NADP-dependent oxidoreductase n=1 Tax=Sphingobacterium siyangense TaxID=459529 RepID=UPI001AD2F7CC|nr:NADP-dependent oxidoreductase [uncultured Dysgonomonas sp.]MBN8880577.1 NADP-dependent oxidoreductase [Sphingobacteriales bacterium]MBN9484386.1 NADP-dependent oxidoreductase [Bacteroidota bacterium]
MKAIILKTSGGVENFALANIPTPEIKSNEVLIKVKAIGINPADARVRNEMKKAYFENATIILGWDASGEIVEIGSDVQDFKVGDEVFGLIGLPGVGRTYAEYVAAPASQIAVKPKNISHEQAAVSTMAALTALQAIRKLGIKQGDRVLITAAGGGVGHFGVQFAKLYGAYVIALASTDKRDFVIGLGADEFIDYKKQRFEDVVKDVDYVLDAVKQDDHILRSLEVLKKGGTLVSLWSELPKEQMEKAKELGVHAVYNVVQASGDDMKFVAGLLEEEKIIPHVSKTFVFEDMAQAHLEIEKGHTQGKIVVQIK